MIETLSSALDAFFFDCANGKLQKKLPIGQGAKETRTLSPLLSKGTPPPLYKLRQSTKFIRSLRLL